MNIEDMKADELAAALDALPVSEVTTAGPVVREDGAQDRQDGEAKAGVVDDRVRTKHQAHRFAFDAVQSGRRDWHGLCLKFVRECFGVDALYPDAMTAWEEAATKHHTTDESRVPNVRPAWFRGGEHWHIVFGIGNAKCISSDIDADEPGAVKVCRLTAIEDAWGYEFVGWADEVNEERVPAPRPRRRVSDLVFRRRMLRRAISNARRRGHDARARRLRRWLDSLR